MLFFSKKFILKIEGEVIAYSYMVDRMLAEFAAAAVNLSMAVKECEGPDTNVQCSGLQENVEKILQKSHPGILCYHSRCLTGSHKSFIWSGPRIQILPHPPPHLQSEEFTFITGNVSQPEMLDHPQHQIYPIFVASTPPPSAAALPAISSQTLAPLAPKRHSQEEYPNPGEKRAKNRSSERDGGEVFFLYHSSCILVLFLFHFFFLIFYVKVFLKLIVFEVIMAFHISQGELNGNSEVDATVR